MSSNRRRASSSSSEQQRRRPSKSRSSSRSHQSPSKENLDEKKARRAQSSLQTSKTNEPSTKTIQRSKSSTHLRANKEKSSKTSGSQVKSSGKKQKTTSKLNKYPSETDLKDGVLPNNAERQDLTARGLSVVPSEITDMTTIRRLILANNNLSGVPPAIRSLVNLEYLDLSRNPLRVKNGLDDYECLPEEFTTLKKLHTLIMAECTLKHIPVAVWGTLSLRILDFSRNRVGYIVGEIGNLIALQHLRFSQMDLDTLPPEIGFCDKLKSIDLTGNPVDNLPETLVECRQLSELKINFQNFHKRLDQYLLELIDDGKIRSEHLPSVIFELENLRMLDLHGTHINFIPIEHTLLHLHDLNLSQNSFVSIPEALCTMEHLKVLDMSENRLEKIDESIVKIQRLETLILSKNRLKDLSGVFARLTPLKHLIVSRNEIRTIDEEFSQSQSLITLDLSYNALPAFPDHCCRLKQLETLDLRYNHLESLPLSLPALINIKSMNTFHPNFRRIGLHLVGNPLSNLPAHLWRTTEISGLYDYLATEEKLLSNHYCHLKVIFIGPKSVGKTSLLMNLMKSRNSQMTHRRTTMDFHVTMFRENQMKIEDGEGTIYAPSETASSILTDQWIEQRISTVGDLRRSSVPKKKRSHDRLLKNYRREEHLEDFFNQATVITKNNLHCTLIDVTRAASFEILYPLIYDSNALFVIPVNLTVLLNTIETARALEAMNEDPTHTPIIDYDALLTDQWLYSHLLYYIESISDHCAEASIAIIGLSQKSPLHLHDQKQQLLEEIHSKVNMFVTDDQHQRRNIRIYSDCFPHSFDLDDENLSSMLLEQFETIAHRWKFVHHKDKRKHLKERLGLLHPSYAVMDYSTCLERFQSHSNANEDGNDRAVSLVEEEIDQMTFDAALDYLKLTGDILTWPTKTNRTILIRPYYLLNQVFARTIFRSDLEEWLNYERNLIFHYSGFYLTPSAFEIDRNKLLKYGEFTWKMLNILFLDQHNDSSELTEAYLIDHCRLMEELHLGFVNESNSNYQEFTNLSFVCPWRLTETCANLDPVRYFTSLEQQRIYDRLKCEQARRFKQHQLWFATDFRRRFIEQETTTDSETHHYLSTQSLAAILGELPAPETIPVEADEVLRAGKLHEMKLEPEVQQEFPRGFYQRLLICLHRFFDERLDYATLTIGRSTEKDFIQISIDEANHQISLLTEESLFDAIEHELIDALFSIYPHLHFRIET